MKKRYLFLIIFIIILLIPIIVINIPKKEIKPIVTNNTNSFIKENIKLNSNDDINVKDFIIDLKHSTNSLLNNNLDVFKDWKLKITDCFNNEVKLTTIYLDENNSVISKEEAIINDELKEGIKGKNILPKSGKYNIQITNNKNKFNTTITIIDNEKPILKLKEITIKEGEEVNINSFIESCTDNSYSCSNLKLTNYEKLPTEVGEYELEFVIQDINGNTSDPVKTKFKIESKYSYTPSYSNNNYTPAQNSYDRSNPIVNKALSLVGSSGLCSEIAEASINTVGKTAWLEENFGGITLHSLTPENFLKIGYEVGIDSVQPGDILYYANGGFGSSHVAIYIGNGNAVHGNFNGMTVIYSMYVPGASNPRVIRIN